MIWKPKVKELTPEEAIAIAKKELTPFWFSSQPLLAGVENEGKSKVVPLNKDFFKKSWLIFLIDPTDYEGENAMLYAKEWYRRYHLNNLGFIIILVPSYDYLKKPESIQKLMERQQISFPVCLDAQGSLALALNASKLPKIVLLDQGKIIKAYDGEEDFDDIELQLHIFLRSTDPGLALLPVFYPKTAGAKNLGRLEFGYKPKLGAPMMVFPAPGFVAGEDGIRKANFGLRPKEVEGTAETAENVEVSLKIYGQWVQGPEGIITNDSNAYLQIISPSKKVAVIAAPGGKTGVDSPRIVLDVNGMPVYDSIMDEDLRMEDSGDTQVKVTKPMVYHVLTGLPQKQRKVGFKFPNAKRAPIAIFGFRFGE